MKELKKLWVDDLRDPSDHVTEEWDWVKNYDSAIKALCTNNYNIVSLDNDLGEEKEGYDIFNWIEERLYWKDVVLDNLEKIYVHTSNVEGAKKMLLAKESFMRRYGVLVCKIPIAKRG